MELPGGKDFVTYCDELITRSPKRLFYSTTVVSCKKCFRFLQNITRLQFPFSQKHIKLILPGTKGWILQKVKK